MSVALFPYVSTDSPAELLEAFVSVAVYELDEESLTNCFLAQEFFLAYCKKFTPSKKQIKEIQKNYLIANFELLEFSHYDEGYFFELKD